MEWIHPAIHRSVVPQPGVPAAQLRSLCAVVGDPSSGEQGIWKVEAAYLVADHATVLFLGREGTVAGTVATAEVVVFQLHQQLLGA